MDDSGARPIETRVIPLLQRPELIPSVARWIYAEWSYEFAAVSPDAWMIGFAAELQHQGVPTTLIALDGDELVGTASLDPSDLPSRSALGPWLSSLYVTPPSRNRGVAGLLLRGVEAEAKLQGWPELYLQTANRAEFFAHRGWRWIEDVIEWDRRITVMAKALA
ncbi:MAG: GNAT family N-acetyltransferase [Gemmatimonadales bacterium]